MPRLQRNSVVVNKSALRLSGMRSIHERLEFGNGLSLMEYDARIQALRLKLAGYNSKLAAIDEEAAEIDVMEKELRAYSEKMLMSVVTHYGKDSLEYLQAGGKPRKSKRTQTNPAPMNSNPVPSAEQAKTNGGVKVAVG